MSSPTARMNPILLGQDVSVEITSVPHTRWSKGSRERYSTQLPSIESLFSLADQQRYGTTEESQNNDSSVQEPHNIEAVVYGLKLAEVLGNMRGSFHPQEQRAVSAWIKRNTHLDGRLHESQSQLLPDGLLTDWQGKLVISD